MTGNTLLKDAYNLVRDDPSTGATAILSFIEEKSFLLKKEMVDKRSSIEYRAIPEFEIRTESEYYYNQNKEAIVIYLNHSNDGVYALHMYDHKNQKTFSAYKHPEQSGLDPYVTKLQPIDSRKRSTKEDLTYLYGFQF